MIRVLPRNLSRLVRRTSGRPRDESPLAYSHSGASVEPTQMEAYGLATVRALLHGLPYIGTTVEGQESLMEGARATLPPRDVDFA